MSCGCPFSKILRQRSSGTCASREAVLIDTCAIFVLLCCGRREREMNPSGEYIGSESIEILVTVQSSRKTCGCALSVLVDTWARFVLFDLRRRETEREKGRLSLPVTRFQRSKKRRYWPRAHLSFL